MFVENNLDNLTTLVNIVSRLRAPDGCPWDRQQTHASIKPYLIEEAYEVLQALDDENSTKICEELGDLLLQILLHAQISSESGQFNIGDVILGIATKLIHRHPHIFGNSAAKDVREIEHEWEVLKQNEREPGESLLSSVPKAMPALSYSHSIQRRAAKIGFDWAEFNDVLEKLSEELHELNQADTLQQRVHEFGDILFSLVNVARWQGVNLEEALRLANKRFYQRFRYMEDSCRDQGTSLYNLSLEEQNALWDEAKRHLL